MLFSDCFGVHWSHFVWSLGQVINVSKAWRVLELCPYLPSSKFLWPVNSGYLRVPFPWPAACERFLSSRLVSVPCSSWVMSFGFENGIPAFNHRCYGKGQGMLQPPAGEHLPPLCPAGTRTTLPRGLQAQETCFPACPATPVVLERRVAPVDLWSVPFWDACFA